MNRTALPFIIAVADSASILAYFLGIDPIIVQVAALAVKLACVPWLLRRNSIAVVQMPLLFALFSLCLTSLAFASAATPGAVAQSLGFLFHLALTLLLVVEEIPAYFRSIAYAAAGSAFVYVGLAAVGGIETIWGRYYYFSRIHPNTGSEIAAGGALCGAISLPIRRFVVLTIPMFASAFLMQGRSALLAIALAVALRAARELYTTSQSRRTQWWTIVMAPFGVAALVIGTPFVVDAMQLNDAYRGIDTGLAGRGDQWQMAWDAFMDRPLTGQGLGWITATQDLGAHQFFLYALAEMGLLAIPIFLGMALLGARAFLIHGWKLVAVAPVIVIMFVNDRFINLNLYPYVLWVFLFALSARTWTVPSAAISLAPAFWRPKNVAVA
jgi:O-antigen ligase